MNGNRLKKARKARRERITRFQRLKSSIKSMENIESDDENYNKNNLKKSRSCTTSSSSNRTFSSAADQDVGGSSSSSVGIFRSSSSISENFQQNSSNFLCLSHGSVSVCGRRREMEDAITVEPGFLSTDFVRFDFFAVYDGHGGSKVAQVCRDRLHQVLAKEIEDEDHQDQVIKDDDDDENCDRFDWEKIMYSCFSKMDDEIIGSGSIEDETGSGSMKTIGSTAVVAILGKEKLVVANCGDSRAVLCRGGIAIPLSRDHKPDRPDELERVEAAGGRVINWNGYRVLGVLATSRSIGDYYLKPYVISKPEVTVNERTVNDEFLILASDGLWDVMTNETVCEVVRKCLVGRTSMRRLSMAVNRNNAGEAAAVLAELAMARGSKDNISVVVVELNKKSSGYLF